jgi:O-antigen/teichoic acid export membrane protein
MILKHAALYTASKGLPAILGFVGLAAYTRLLTTQEFGLFAVAIAIASVFSLAFFKWLRLVLLRYTADSGDETLLSHIQFIFLVTSGLLVFLAVFAGLLFEPFGDTYFIPLIAAICISQSWFELHLTHSQASLRPRHYGVLLSAKSLIALTIGIPLALLGVGYTAPLIGLISAHIGITILFTNNRWRIRPAFPDLESTLKPYFKYGLPLASTYIITWIITSTDRLILTYFHSEHAAGIYTAAYQLAYQPTTLVFTIIYTATFPLIIRALDRTDLHLQRTLHRSAELIFGIGISAGIGIYLLREPIAHVLLGLNFREYAMPLILPLAIASVLHGLKSYYFDISFHLKSNTKPMMWIAAACATTNLLLNLILIPSYGAHGAAWSSAVAFLLGALLSATLSLKQGPLRITSSMIGFAMIAVVITTTTTALALVISETHWIQLALSALCVSIVLAPVVIIRHRLGEPM